MSNQITEAVIVVGGMGTRLLPYTKTVTKEMLPILDVPTIYLLVKEAYLSGIKNIIFVVNNRNKKLIKNFFTNDKFLNDFIKDEPDKQLLLKDINEIIKNMNFKYVLQVEKGSYGSLYSARNHIKNDNFIVMYGDDITDSKVPLTKQLINEFERNQKMYMTIRKLDDINLPKTGVIKIDQENYLIGITDKKNSSQAIALGRFLLNKKIFKIKDKLEYHKHQELYLPHSLLNFKNEIKCYYYQDNYFNIGDKLGYIKASLYFAFKDQNRKEELLKYIEEIK